jgi:hypothetical protein
MIVVDGSAAGPLGALVHAAVANTVKTLMAMTRQAPPLMGEREKAIAQ